MLQELIISHYRTDRGLFFECLPLSYQIFGQDLGTAPVVLIFHALTGNSQVVGRMGWWNELIGNRKTIDLQRFTVLAFDIPGNGYNDFLINDYKAVTLKDVTRWFLEGLAQLHVTKIFAGIGGSLGGMLLWQMAILQPDLFQNIIPIAADWKASAWVIALCTVQEQILRNSIHPIYDARLHAMTFYRSPDSLKARFGRTKNTELGVFNVQSWLFHHGEKLKKRFPLAAYLLMNHLMLSAGMDDIDFYNSASKIKGRIQLIGIDSDGLFVNSEIKITYSKLKPYKSDVFYSEIHSLHGHDAFLIEYQQLSEILNTTFNQSNYQNKNRNHELTIQ